MTITIADEHGDPLKLVQAAVAADQDAKREATRQRDANLEFDQVWCVFDVDNHERLRDALTLAASKRIFVAVTNPCFELWALLHFTDHRAHVTAAAVQRLLAGHMPGYKKSLDCSLLIGKYADARQRAKTLEAQHASAGEDSRSNPSSEVWRLNDALLQAARDAGVQRTF